MPTHFFFVISFIQHMDCLLVYANALLDIFYMKFLLLCKCHMNKRIESMTLAIVNGHIAK